MNRVGGVDRIEKIWHVMVEEVRVVMWVSVEFEKRRKMLA